jgi:hypothetical protein
VLPDPSKEHGLADDGLGSRAFRGKRVDQGLVERFGLPGRIRDARARSGLDEQLIGDGAAEPAKNDRGSARLASAIGWCHRQPPRA